MLMVKVRRRFREGSAKVPLRSVPILKAVSEFGIRPPPMLLSLEFAQGVMPARLGAMKQAKLTKLHKQFIVWGLEKGFSRAYIATVMGCHPRTIHDWLEKLRREEGILLDVGVVERIMTGKNGRAVRYFCRVCGATYRDIKPAADHAFYHVFPDGGGLIVPMTHEIANR